MNTKCWWPGTQLPAQIRDEQLYQHQRSTYYARLPSARRHRCGCACPQRTLRFADRPISFSACSSRMPLMRTLSLMEMGPSHPTHVLDVFMLGICWNGGSHSSFWNGLFATEARGTKCPCFPPFSFLGSLTDGHNEILYRVMVWQEKDKCKHCTNSVKRNIWMSAAYFLLREFGNLGILAVGHGYFGKLVHICTRKKSSHSLHFTHQMSYWHQHPRPVWEQKRLN